MSFAGLRRRPVKAVRALLTFSTLASLAACGGGGGDSTPTPPTQTPTISIALSASTLNVQAGANGTVTVTLTRGGGFTGDVAIAVEGLPAGVTGPNATIAAGATSATLSISAAATAAAATTNLTIRATGTGVAAATAALALTVTAAPVAGSFSLALSPTSVSLAQGASSTVTINITRTGSFTGAVNLAVAGAGAGLTPTLSATSVTGNSATLTLAAAATLATGSQTLTISGTGTGAANQSVTLPVTITASQPSTGNVSWKFCGTSGLPLWVAAQDGTGAWTRVTGTNDTYAFTINGTRGGVAYVLPMGTGFDLEVFYGTTAELVSRGNELCNGAVGAGKAVSATVAGASGTDLVLATLGRSTGTVTLPQIAFTGVQSGNVDLLASRSTLTLSGTTPSMNLQRMIIRRNLNPAAGSSLAVDFGAAEAFEPVTRNVTVNNVGSDISLVVNNYLTANNSMGIFQIDIAGGGSARSYRGVPAANQVNGDLHVLAVSGVPSLTSTSTTRNVIAVFRDATDKTITLGPTLSAPTFSSLSGGGYGRTRAVLNVQSEYNRYFVVDVQQTTGSPRKTQVAQTSGYASGTSLTIDVPDFSGVAGFDANWGLRIGTAGTYTVSATGWTGTGGTTTAPFIEGATFSSGTRQGSVTP